MRRLIAGVVMWFFCGCATMAYSGDWLYGNGFEDNAADSPWWVWTAYDSQTTGKQIVTSDFWGGKQSIGLDCSSAPRYLFKQFIQPGTTGGAATATQASICVWSKIPAGLLSTNGTTDIFGLDTTGSTHGNNQGVALLSEVNHTALKIRGGCTSSDYSMTVDDGAWHRYCMQFDSTQSGSNDFIKVWVDDNPAIASPTLSCTGTLSSSPNGAKISCAEGVDGIPAGDRLFDDLVARDDLTRQEDLWSSRVGLINIMGPTNQNCDGGHCDVMGLNCSGQTTAPEKCLDGTYSEPGDGANNNTAATTHNIRLDQNGDYFETLYSGYSDLINGEAATLVFAILPEIYATEVNANNQVKLCYGTESETWSLAPCGSALDWNSSLTIHRAIYDHASRGKCGPTIQDVCAVNADCSWAGDTCSGQNDPLDMVRLAKFTLKLEKVQTNGRFQLETLYVPYLWHARRFAAITGGGDD